MLLAHQQRLGDSLMSNYLVLEHMWILERECKTSVDFDKDVLSFQKKLRRSYFLKHWYRND